MYFEICLNVFNTVGRINIRRLCPPNSSMLNYKTENGDATAASITLERADEPPSHDLIKVSSLIQVRGGARGPPFLAGPLMRSALGSSDQTLRRQDLNKLLSMHK